MPKNHLRKTVRTQFTDEDTGVVHNFISEEKVQSRRPRDTRTNETFGLIYVESIPRLLAMDLNKTDWELLLHLISLMQFEAPFIASPTKIGLALGIDRRNVAPRMTRLVRLGLVWKVARARIWINPNFAWRGGTPMRMQTIYEYEKKSNGYAVGERES